MLETLHFRIAGFASHVPVHNVEILVDGMHVVGMTQFEKFDGSQQPATPL